MVVRKGAVDLVEQQVVLPGQASRQIPEDGTDGAVAGVPGHAQIPLGGEVAGQAVNIGVGDGGIGRRSRALGIVAGGRQSADFLHLLAIDRAVGADHLDAVVLRRVVRPRDHDAAVGPPVLDREIQHRSRPEPDPLDRQAAGDQPVDHGSGQARRAEPAVIADAGGRAAGADDLGAEGPADGVGVGLGQRFSDDAADVVGPQDAGVDAMSRCHWAASPGLASGMATPSTPDRAWRTLSARSGRSRA